MNGSNLPLKNCYDNLADLELHSKKKLCPSYIVCVRITQMSIIGGCISGQSMGWKEIDAFQKFIVPIGPVPLTHEKE